MKFKSQHWEEETHRDILDKLFLSRGLNRGSSTGQKSTYWSLEGDDLEIAVYHDLDGKVERVQGSYGLLHPSTFTLII